MISVSFLIRNFGGKVYDVSDCVRVCNLLKFNDRWWFTSSVRARNFSFGAQGPLSSKKLETIEKIWGQHNFFFLCLTQSEHLMILSSLSYTSHGNNRNHGSWKPRFIWLLSFSLVLVCHVRFLSQQLGMKGQIDRLSIGRGLSSLSLVEDSVFSPLDPLGKKLNIDRSFLLHSAMTTYQQYCASDHVLSIHETRTLIGSPYPIRRHDIIGSRYPEHFCQCKYK